ncbi:MAG: bifunctional phosphoribosylaminoimidazolecarboxamide formyltransferase/IMP cyclohydrolase [Syntrophales bacterium]|nr:bifunctional phosphoribosylaminoimidazolecarboxamide formyltransferase/IMP cyclohydrolase [Syntrophales bacterium]
MKQNKIKTALISLTDKQGIEDFARGLLSFGVEILSTGGTAEHLRRAGVPVLEVSDYTQFPEIMDGRVKTLHPKIHGGILAKRDSREHLVAAEMHNIKFIDMLVINLYQFEKIIARENSTLDEILENIDIGGPAMIRAGAKNYKYVTVITDPEDYPSILREMNESGGSVSEGTNFKLALKAFQLTARYDGIISNYLGRLRLDGELRPFPETFTFQVSLVQELRYGENPHQKAAFYREISPTLSSIASARQLQGKELSYNNIMDADAAWQAVNDFSQPAAVIVKHANPCGVAISKDLKDAFFKALETDPVSAFGGIVAFNRPVDAETARLLTDIFLEIVIAPAFEEDAKVILSSKKNLRILEVPCLSAPPKGDFDFRRVVGGLLVQERDYDGTDIRKAKVVTERHPTDEEYEALDFAWRVVKYVKSNAIVVATKDKLLGVGAGQMSRVDAVRIALMKAGSAARGAVLASDAFFPFRDSVDLAAQAGITAIIQPGGSLRDEESIVAANEHGIAMIFTGVRHFRH